MGAGPGDPGLMTRRSLELIAAADAILYDRLIPAGALDGAREDAELIYVGKAPGDVAMAQDEINARLVELGGRGLEVVRLKGGDPFVFGRGGEEAEALRAAGVPFEVVPGVTSGVAAPAYAGIPVTHRDLASAVAFVTGHEDPAKEESALDWEALARFPGTLVLYMGVKNLPRIAESLIAAGRPPDQPAAVVERGTLPGQRAASAPLSEIAARVADEGLRAPAITVIGPAAGLRETLAWIEARPLHGKVVAVTRARAQASGLAARLAALGAEVVEAPAIRIEPLEAALPELGLARARLLHQPERRGPVLRRPGRRRPRPRRGDRRRDRAGNGPRAGRAGRQGRRRAAAIGGGVAGGGAGERGRGRQAGADRPCGRGA